jgi:hypothetical protein
MGCTDSRSILSLGLHHFTGIEVKYYDRLLQYLTVFGRSVVECRASRGLHRS